MSLDGIRTWAKGYTDERRYSPVGVVFHWAMAALIVFQLGWGLYTDVAMPGGDKVLAYQVHSAAGLPVILLGLMRTAWRVAVPGPVNDADSLGWQTTTARVTHVLFYTSFVALPLSGWVMWSSLAPPGALQLAGVLPWPQVPLEMLSTEARYLVMHGAERVHYVFILLLLVLIPVHAGAALKHHFWDRHDVLRGMLPEMPDLEHPREAQTRNPPARDSHAETPAG